MQGITPTRLIVCLSCWYSAIPNLMRSIKYWYECIIEQFMDDSEAHLLQKFQEMLKQAIVRSWNAAIDRII
jgi:hypothetical protein